MTPISQVAIAKAQILIRRPVSDVFAAFVDRRQITRFWLASASDSLVPNGKAHWEFQVEGATDEVSVKDFENDKRILIDCSDGTTLELTFDVHADGTVVSVLNGGFEGSDAEIIATAIESTQGFTLVLCDLKTLLETGRTTRIVSDKAQLIQEALQNSRQ
jgi:uncharacterized protein YndB with AHSA1/START domain